MSVKWNKQPSTTPIEIPERTGMTISLGGVLNRATEWLEPIDDAKYLTYGLQQLRENIEELRRVPTEETLGEFLSLWT